MRFYEQNNPKTDKAICENRRPMQEEKDKRRKRERSEMWVVYQ
jgi:hypothetical protein